MPSAALHASNDPTASSLLVCIPVPLQTTASLNEKKKKVEIFIIFDPASQGILQRENALHSYSLSPRPEHEVHED